MQSIITDVAGFIRQSRSADARAGALFSAQLLCGDDLQAALRAPARGREQLARKLQIRLERERQKGLRAHWSYNLDRHIGLRQALDLLQAAAFEN